VLRRVSASVGGGGRKPTLKRLAGVLMTSLLGLAMFVLIDVPECEGELRSGRLLSWTRAKL
jgi:hypothetical protein